MPVLLDAGSEMPIDVNGFITAGGGLNSSGQNYMQAETRRIESSF